MYIHNILVILNFTGPLFLSELFVTAPPNMWELCWLGCVNKRKPTVVISSNGPVAV